MHDVKTRIDEMLNELKQERERLQVKLHLAKLEAGDEWEKLEAKLAKLEAKARQLGDTTAEASKDIGAAAKLLGEEISAGFKKIASRF
jgi:chromosome segregation ATPase